MDSDDDFELFSNSEEAAPPVRETKLKRLKKAIKASEDPPIDGSESGRVNPSEFEALTLEESNEPSKTLRIGSESLGGEGETNSGFDGLNGLDGEAEMHSGFNCGEGEMNSGFNGGEGEMNSGFNGGEGEMNSGFNGGGEMGSGFDDLDFGEDGSGAKRALDFESVGEEFSEKGEDQNQEMPEESGDVMLRETDKKRRSFDGTEEDKGKKKSKRAKSETTASKSKRMTEKERRDHLKQLHAESQRLLRETRDAAFKPVPLVQKPISSVLEKIRKRKLEISQKCNGKVDNRVLKVGIEEQIACQTEMECGADGVRMEGSNDLVEQAIGENVSSRMDVDVESKQMFRAPIDDTQELFSDSQTTDSKDDQPNDAHSSPLEEVFAPSILAMNLKLDSAPQVDVSSDEDDNDKENMNPHSSGVADLPSSPIGDPVKAFVDDEAEEEDDSDHDLLRFQDSEEDEDDEDVEELNEMIATGYEERPIDGERRTELHQKWLEQQDASGTEKLMKKLKFGSKLKETSLREAKHADGEKDGDGENDTDREEDEEFDEESLEDSAPTDAVQMSLKEIKQMIPLMFTDNDDVYLSSDDEETEKRLAKQCLSEKSEEHATFLSPADDESSREVFGLIKKLNIVPDAKKAKTPAFSNMLLMGGDKVISSKASFLGRESNHSLPRKNGLSTVRSIIFGRADINSRNTSSVSEDSSDTIERENLPSRATSAKFSNSRAKIKAVPNTDASETSGEAISKKTDTSSQAVARTETSRSSKAVRKTHTLPVPKAVMEKDTSPSLLELLRHPSLQSEHRAEENMIDQIEAVLTSFKVGRKSVQAKRGVIRRT